MKKPPMTPMKPAPKSPTGHPGRPQKGQASPVEAYNVIALNHQPPKCAKLCIRSIKLRLP